MVVWAAMGDRSGFERGRGRGTARRRQGQPMAAAMGQHNVQHNDRAAAAGRSLSKACWGYGDTRAARRPTPARQRGGAGGMGGAAGGDGGYPIAAIALC